MVEIDNDPGTPLDNWTVWRIDDHGNKFIVQEHLAKLEANRLVEEFTARGPKQVYWIERDN